MIYYNWCSFASEALWSGGGAHGLAQAMGACGAADEQLEHTCGEATVVVFFFLGWSESSPRPILPNNPVRLDFAEVLELLLTAAAPRLGMTAKS